MFNLEDMVKYTLIFLISVHSLFLIAQDYHVAKWKRQ